MKKGTGTALGLLILALAALAAGAQKQPPLPGEAANGPREGTYLYRFQMLQAGPEKLQALIDLHRNRAPVMASGGDERPVIVKHSQGDHWDLLIIHPCGTLSDYYGRERTARREAAAAASGLSSADFARRSDGMTLWQEDLFVLGPPVEILREFVKEAGVLHFEMLRSLPGKFEELVEERRMENAYNQGRGRGRTLIFVRALGADWDVVTLGAYRNWRQYAESELIPPEVSEAAARKAGFADAASVGNFMRTLISTHRDTLGPPVAIPDK